MIHTTVIIIFSCLLLVIIHVVFANIDCVLLFVEGKKKYTGKAVAPSDPRTEKGQYWGYKTRLVSCLSDVFSQCPYKGGYDMTIGTSERGDNVDTYSLPRRFR